MRVHQRIAVLLFSLLLLFSGSFLFADSDTFFTEINGISNGVNGFGRGLFPVGTSFTYAKYAKVFDSLTHSARFHMQSDFSFSNTGLDTNYSYDEGTPRWYLTRSEQGNYKFFDGIDYFNPRGRLLFYVQQPFGINPYSKSGSLVTFRLGLDTRYSIALENTITSNDGSGFHFVDDDGNARAPFGPDASFKAFPWMSGDREAWNTFIYLDTYWNFNKSRGVDALDDGIYAELDFEYGPKWLFNNIMPKGVVSSDYWRIYGYLSEKMTLVSLKQENDWNWISVLFGHENSVSYFGGNTIPEQKIPSDRFRAYLSDSVYLRMYLPQFIAYDCWSYLSLSLNNTLYFGHVVNEASQSTKAVELKSGLSGTFHMRLFGFIRFEYSVGYDFIKGIWAANPGWWQNAELRFYISV